MSEDHHARVNAARRPGYVLTGVFTCGGKKREKTTFSTDSHHLNPRETLAEPGFPATASPGNAGAKYVGVGLLESRDDAGVC